MCFIFRSPFFSISINATHNHSNKIEFDKCSENFIELFFFRFCYCLNATDSECIFTDSIQSEDLKLDQFERPENMECYEARKFCFRFEENSKIPWKQVNCKVSELKLDLFLDVNTMQGEFCCGNRMWCGQKFPKFWDYRSEICSHQKGRHSESAIITWTMGTGHWILYFICIIQIKWTHSGNWQKRLLFFLKLTNRRECSRNKRPTKKRSEIKLG